MSDKQVLHMTYEGRPPFSKNMPAAPSYLSFPDYLKDVLLLFGGYANTVHGLPGDLRVSMIQVFKHFQVFKHESYPPQYEQYEP